MDARALRVPHGLAGARDIGLDGTGEARHGGALGALGDGGDGFEIAFGGDGEARLDDVDAHLVEHGGRLKLVLEAHGGAGALLAVTQGGVEDDDAVGVGCFEVGCHG